MEACACCQHLLRDLNVHFRQANEEQFFQTWKSLVDSVEMKDQQEEDLSLLVRFKLLVHFAVAVKDGTSMEKLSNFLQQNGTRYSKFPQLAPYFALPYIKDNLQHPLLVEIRKEEWIENLEQEWKELIKVHIHPNHGDVRSIEKQDRNYTRLREKYLKLKEDHKILIDLASQLVSALEDSLRGQTKFAIETFEYYSQEIKLISDDTIQSEGPEKFQWEAPSLRKSTSSNSIHSEALD